MSERIRKDTYFLVNVVGDKGLLDSKDLKKCKQIHFFKIFFGFSKEYKKISGGFWK